MRVDFSEWGPAELVIAGTIMALLVALFLWATRRRRLPADQQRQLMAAQFDRGEPVRFYTYHWSLSEEEIRDMARWRGYYELAPQRGRYGQVLRFTRAQPPY